MIRAMLKLLWREKSSLNRLFFVFCSSVTLKCCVVGNCIQNIAWNRSCVLMNPAKTKHFCYTINTQEKTKAATCTVANSITTLQPSRPLWPIGQPIPSTAQCVLPISHLRRTSRQGRKHLKSIVIPLAISALSF